MYFLIAIVINWQVEKIIYKGKKNIWKMFLLTDFSQVVFLIVSILKTRLNLKIFVILQ